MSITATFTRASVATKQDGTQVAADIPRYETGHSGQAIMVEEGSTNKCTCYGVPQASDTVGVKSFYSGGAWTQGVTNMTLSGNTAAVLSIVTDQAAIDAAGLTGRVNGGKVYKLDNSVGVIDIFCTIGGVTGNTNPHSISIYFRGAGLAYVDNGTDTLWISVENGLTTAWLRHEVNGAIPNSGVGGMRIYARAGQIIYFILPQLEEKPYTTSIMPTFGATATRAAEALTIPTAGVLNAAQGTIACWVEAPSINTGIFVLTATYPLINANNMLGIFFEEGILKARLGTGTTIATLPALTAYVINTWYHVVVTWDAQYVYFYINNVLQGVSATAHNIVFPSNYSIGSQTDGVNQMNSLIDDLRIFNRALTANEIAQVYGS